MKSIEQINQQNDTKSLISSFLNLIGLAKLTKKVNFKRKSVVSLSMVISWLMSVHFARRSLYRAKKDDNFSIRTARNVLNDSRINWQKLLCLIGAKLIATLKPVIDKRRRLAFIVDDTLMARSFSKKTELLAKVYDHDKHEFLTGYRGLTLGWSDGNTFLPVNFALMSTKKKENLIGKEAITSDRRSIAGRRRLQAKRQMNDVTVEQIIQLYGHRWQIETYFKTAKQYLALNKSQIQNYDGQCGYIAAVAITYDLLAWQERQNIDDKTIGDIFYLMNDSLSDIRFIDALVYLISTLKNLLNKNKSKIDQAIEEFIDNLPKFIRGKLKQMS